MTGITAAEAATILNLRLGISPSANRYLALTKVAPTSADTGSTLVEPTSGDYDSYARAPLFNPQVFTAPSVSAGSVSTTNQYPITFAECVTGNTAEIYGWAVCDALTGGNVLYYGTIPNILVGPSVQPVIAVGTLTIGFSL